ncbi:hypothetical protein GCM10027512_11700 [Chromohalobacter beijerinckii]
MTQDFEQARQVLDFWFVEAGPKQWFNKSASFDKALTERFGALHDAACRCELYAWRQSSHGALAEILLLDQFSRNIYRDQALAFAQDPLALSLAQHLVARGGDQALPPRTARVRLYAAHAQRIARDPPGSPAAFRSAGAGAQS